MKKNLIFLAFLIGFSIPSFSTSYVGSDLTYDCLGGNTYLITYSYYRDCSGAPAQTSVNVTYECSTNSAFNFTSVLTQIPGTGQEVTPGCGCDPTTCSGGTAFGVRLYVYQTLVTLVACNKWKMSTSYCCRNAVTAVDTSASNPYYIETTLNNLSSPCNSSPTFSNVIISIPCNGSAYCYTQGAIDPDGDSLVYSFFTPKLSNGSPIAYIGAWSASNFLTSSTPITIDPITGDIYFTPSVLMSSITGVKVEQWRTINGTLTLTGETYRNLQFRVQSCNNNIPLLSGIDTLNTHTYDANDTLYNMTWNLGQTIDFDINGYDADTATPNCYAHPDEFSILWNNGIPSGSFTPHFNGTDSAYAHFHWVPTWADVAILPHCFTATIQDKACPYNGSQTFSYCLTITSGVGFENNKNIEELSVYPNPSTGQIAVYFPTKNNDLCQVTVFDMQGKKVFEQVWSNPDLKTNHKIDLSSLSNGVYYLQIIQASKIIKTKVLIQR